MSIALKKQIELYIQRATEMLVVADHNLNNGFYASSVNRRYYAVFYAVNAILTTKNLNRKRHSGVMSTFRQHFVKTGIIEPMYSEIYGRLFDDRNTSDYQLSAPVTEQVATIDLTDARSFVARITSWLKQEGWL